jgi:hypothetical protein
MGIIQHSNIFVVSNKVPEYGNDELQLRSLKTSCKDLVTEMLSEWEKTNCSYMDFKDLSNSSQ